MTDLTKEEGSLSFWMQHEQTDWATNKRAYKFPEATMPPVRIAATKESDCTLMLVIQGPLNRGFLLKVPLQKILTSPPDARGVHLELTWGNGEIILYLNGVLIDIIDAERLPESKHLKKPSVH